MTLLRESCSDVTLGGFDLHGMRSTGAEVYMNPVVISVLVHSLHF